jgi:predicted AlkP superfamily pyrophosphatase or phosphodiesterase
MRATPDRIERVILVVLDGLRADAVVRYELPTLSRLVGGGAHALDATTVAPSITSAAIASLLTGVSPDTHGLRSDRFHIPRAAAPLTPLPRALADAGYRTSAYLASLPRLFRGIANRIKSALGVARASFFGEGAPEILEAARPELAAAEPGLVFLHWPDADRAGHKIGWMTAEYERAARRLDDALGRLVDLTGVESDPSTVLIALADHGGGGVDLRSHESDHPADRTIPLMIAGGLVEPGARLHAATLLDVPATVLWALGVRTPAVYAGRPLIEAFQWDVVEARNASMGARTAAVTHGGLR